MDIQITAAIVALTEIIKRLVPERVSGIVIIIVSAVLGGLAGYANLNGLDIISGVVTGLAASGVYKVGQVVSGK